MLEFVLKNFYFESNGNVTQELSGTTVGTNCARPYAFTFMDKGSYIDDVHFEEGGELR